MVMDDDDDDEKDDDKKMTLRQKLQAVQDATQTVQVCSWIIQTETTPKKESMKVKVLLCLFFHFKNALGDIASICESTRK